MNNSLSSAKKDYNQISFMRWPYYWLGHSSNNGDSRNPKWVGFWGNDFYNTTDIDFNEFIARTNQCLDYVRKNCAGCELIYRPHPEEREEIKLLNLASFVVQKDGQAAEEFLLANRENIKYSFSFCSTSSIAGLNLGVNSYIFYRCFADIFDGINKIFTDNYLKGLPENFFINNFETPLVENKLQLNEDAPTKIIFEDILTEHGGPIWFIVQENRYLLTILGLKKIIKTLFPERKVNFIISKHHRWSDDKLKHLRSQFDKVISIPRVFYSLKPLRLISALTISRKIKKIKLESGSILIGLAHHDFVENCFMSYNRDKFKLAILPESVWRLNFKTEDLGFDTNKFAFNKASFFFNHFLEPVLGLNRTRFMHHEKGSNMYFIRLHKPIEDIYDKVLLIKNFPVDF
ncbi:MAG: hypothetical protein A2606_01720 [Candidatus Yanofskybacteria bacterium RIFOXYD1_FULL_42_10]|uniref:Uncharacterized protein n=1 Tax=Candidatus Yanofskybacteria bacterium RIFOXYD1_FULL_42_10 TaxID=1802718 RepID=A0A1F8HSI1_9BACT|nr:MAG: hypothetical protein A2606_01720 [Candidatus Yanofskybacteria bacterium RIFOXYD1_FULL_42_10]